MEFTAVLWGGPGDGTEFDVGGRDAPPTLYWPLERKPVDLLLTTKPDGRPHYHPVMWRPRAPDRLQVLFVFCKASNETLTTE